MRRIYETKIKESANGFNVNVVKNIARLRKCKICTEQCNRLLNTSFNIELGKITGIIEGIDETTDQKISSAIQQSASGWQGVFKSMECLKMEHLYKTVKRSISTEMD